MGLLELDYAAIALATVQVVLCVVVLILAKFALNALSPYRVEQEMTSLDNPAFGLAASGYFAGTVIIYLSAAGSAPLPLDDGARAVFIAIGTNLAWTVAGIVALNGSRWLMDRMLVTHVRNDREISEHRNVAAGALECGAYLGASALLAGAMRQPGGTLWTAAAIFLIGQLALILLGRFYQRWSGYDLGAEIRAGNLAAGVAFAMTLAALSLLMLKAISGEFRSWTQSLSFFGFDAIVGLILLLLLRWVTYAALLRRASVVDEIVRDRNVNVGLIEGVFALGIAATIMVLF